MFMFRTLDRGFSAAHTSIVKRSNLASVTGRENFWVAFFLLGALFPADSLFLLDALGRVKIFSCGPSDGYRLVALVVSCSLPRNTSC
jgi:hypothetical protein